VMTRVIAIDGPSGAGKGTVARAVARQLGWKYIDTGAMYRAVAWKTRHEGVDPDDEPRAAAIARRARIDLDEHTVRIDGHDVTAAIRTPEIDAAAAAVARMPGVRAALVAQQRDYKATYGQVVMEGRDIGTAVFPDADVKIYLDAAPQERAARRAKDPTHGVSRVSGLAEVASALAARDRSDRMREASPLTRAPDAVLIDTTGVPVDEVVRRVLQIVEEKLHQAGRP